MANSWQVVAEGRRAISGAHSYITATASSSLGSLGSLELLPSAIEMAVGQTSAPPGVVMQSKKVVLPTLNGRMHFCGFRADGSGQKRRG